MALLLPSLLWVLIYLTPYLYQQFRKDRYPCARCSVAACITMYSYLGKMTVGIMGMDDMDESGRFMEIVRGCYGYYYLY